MLLDRGAKMDFQTRRLISLIIVCSYLFLGGVEFAVIFPTAWEYLQSLGCKEEYLLGITVAAYSLSAAVAGVIGGRWSDRHPSSTKTLCLMCITVMVAGNLQYLIGYNVWNVVVSRFVCGLGTGAGAALLGYVCRTTTITERTAMLSICNASRQIGIFIGPAFQFFLTYIDFEICGMKVTRLNAAGLIMSVLWVFFIIACVMCFQDLTHEWQELRHIEIPRQDECPLKSSMSLAGNSMAISLCESVSVAPPDEITFDTYSEEILRDTIMSLLGTVFTIFFGQILVETLIPVFMKDYFGFGDVETSFMYMAGGLECLLMLGLVILISKAVPDWALHLSGLLIFLMGFALFTVILPSFTPGDSSNFIKFVAACLLVGAGYPITSVANASLISKCLSVQSQGTGQGLRRLLSYLGLVMGPMWAGAAVKYPSLLMGVTLGLVVLQLVLYLDTLPRFIRIERTALARQSDPGEVTPLLNPTIRETSSHNSWAEHDLSATFSGEFANLRSFNYLKH